MALRVRLAWALAAAAFALAATPEWHRFAAAADTAPSPVAVRVAARAAGLAALNTVRVPKAPNLNEFLRPGSEATAVQLGKALFWDVQVGSDGQACASCHFHAGADNRTKNQINPGTRGEDTKFGVTVTTAGAARATAKPNFGANFTLSAGDFPLHLLGDDNEANYNKRVVLRDTNDVVSSQGVLKSLFGGIGTAVHDVGTAQPDSVFHVADVNTRRVEPRNTPSVINAVFNHDNFWDGRAQNVFNGVDPFGLLSRDAKILLVEGGKLVEQRIEIPTSSLASQSVGPPVNEDEMSYAARAFPDIGKKVLPLRPLATQLVDPQDSVLGPLARGTPGLTTAAYADMIRAVFLPQYWDAGDTVTFDGERRVIGKAADGAKSYSVMEANFALFFGLAVQMYEATLVSDQTPFDRFMGGDDAALDADQLRGLLLFVNRGKAEQKADPVFAGVGRGNCVACHGGAELTNVSETFYAAGIHLADVTAEMNNGVLQEGTGTMLFDRGFSNIGVRPTAEDIGHGGKQFGIPLSTQPLAIGGEIEILVENQPPPPMLGIYGAFKIPGLRNAELTGPYFHNGGEATLEQVVEFYARLGDFADVNIDALDVGLARVALETKDQAPLTKFLLALTDERVRIEAAPFDHPQLLVPDGHPGDATQVTCATGFLPCEAMIESPAVGARGRVAKGLAPLRPFLNLPQLSTTP